MAAGLGFEPRLLGPEPSVLPLDDPAWDIARHAPIFLLAVNQSAVSVR